MDPMSFLLIVIIMIIAVQQGLWWVGVGLAGLLLFAAGKSRIMIFAFAIGVGAIIVLKYSNLGYTPLILLGALVLILVLLGRKEEKDESDQAAYQQMMAMYGQR